MKQAADLLRALADEERLRILKMLESQEEGVCVCELVDAARLPQYQVSRQLAVLRDAGLVSGEKRGNWVYYQVSPDLTPLASALLEALKANMDAQTVEEDRMRLRKRLRLRAKGLCVVGYEPGRLFRESIPIILEESSGHHRR